MQYDFGKNHFELFSLAAAFRIDRERLDSAYREIQSTVHPDKFARLSDAERRMSMQWATHANEAYRTLKQPIDRARYLLALHRVDTQEENNTAMPMDFLMEQMELREAIGEARAQRNLMALEKLQASLKAQTGMLLERLESQLDVAADYAKAAQSVRKLRFLEKVSDEIQDAIDIVEE